MQLLRIELREIVLRRKGWLLIVCSLIVYGLVIWHDTGNHLVNQYYNDWKDCEVLKQLEGSYNEEKEDIVHNLRINYDKALLQLDSEKEKYQSGLIDVEEYQKNAGEYIRIMKEYLLVRTVEEQYDYVIEDIEHRYFCNYNGWNYFFGRDSLKILYVIVIFLMLIPLFAEESENGIHGLLLSCENGCGKLFFSRIFAGMVVVVVYTGLMIVLELGLIHIQYGLISWDFPIQSLPFYETYEGTLVIRDLFLREVVCRLLGGIYFTIICIVLVLIMRKALNALVSGIILYFAPYFVLNSAQLCRLPFPMTMVEASCWTQWFRLPETGEQIFLNTGEIMLQSVEVVLLMLLLLIFSWIIYHEKLNRLKCRFQNIRRNYLVAFLCIICTTSILSGCGSNDTNVECMENSSPYNYLVSNEYYIVISSENPYLLYDVENGTLSDLFLDPFLSSDDYEDIEVMFLDETDVYYLKRNGVYESIWRMDCKTKVKEKICDLREDEPEGIDLWGLMEDDAKFSFDLYQEYLQKCQRFYLYQDKIYILDGEGIAVYNKKGDFQKWIITDIVNFPAFCDGAFYYIDQYGFLVMFDCDTQEKQTITSRIIDEFYVVTDCIYVKDRLGVIYRISINETTENKVTENAFRLLYAEDDELYFVGEDTMTVYKATGAAVETFHENERVLQLIDAGRGKMIMVSSEKNAVEWKIKEIEK